MNDELYHHGILNQKWGVRRYQNPDGSLTEEGRKRYGKGIPKAIKNVREKSIKKDYEKLANTAKAMDKNDKDYRQQEQKLNKASRKYATKMEKADNAKYDLDTEQEIGKNKLFGNTRNVRKAEAKYNQAKLEEKSASDEFTYNDRLLSKIKVNGAELKDVFIRDLNDVNEKVDKYITKYGTLTMKELIDRDPDFRNNITIAESKKKYQYYDNAD